MTTTIVKFLTSNEISPSSLMFQNFNFDSSSDSVSPGVEGPFLVSRKLKGVSDFRSEEAEGMVVVGIAL